MKAALGHRGRILRALQHEEVDRMPCFFAADDRVRERVKDAFGLRDWYGILGFLDADTVHVRVVSKEGATTLPSLTGVQSVSDLSQLRWPGRDDLDLDACIRATSEANERGFAVLSGVWTSIFTHPRRLMGEEKFLLGLTNEPELIASVVERATDSFLDMNEAFFSACAKYVDVFYFGSDFGTQRSMFISQDMFRRFFKPHLRRLTQHAKGFGVKVMYHTCGAIGRLIPDLVECGIDMLDPVQVSAVGMSPPELARQHKGSIVFHGGISTQTTLPFGSPLDVRREVFNTIKSLGPLGYVVGPDQDMIGDVPTDNIMAMYSAIHEFPL